MNQENYFVNKTIMIFPEGPLGFDGIGYCYSKGELFYLEKLALTFSKVMIVTQILRSGDPYYESVIHSNFQADNIEVVELPRCKFSIGVFSKLLHLLKIFFAVGRLSKKADLFYLFLPSYPSAVAWIWARILSKKHIVYGADDWVQASPGMFKWPHLRDGFFYKIYCNLNCFMEKMIVSTCTFAVAAGGQLVHKYREFGARVEPTTPRIIISEIDIFNRADTCDGELVYLINVGSLNHDKAQHLLIQAFALLVPRNSRLRLIIVGGGDRLNELVTIANKLGVSHLIEFKGYIDNTETLYEIYRQSDIFVLSSVSEGFPRVLYEAMTMSLPLVTTSCGGIEYLIRDRFNGLVVDSGSFSAIAEAIEEIIIDGDLRKQLIENGKTTMMKVFNSVDHQQIARMYKG